MSLSHDRKTFETDACTTRDGDVVMRVRHSVEIIIFIRSYLTCLFSRASILGISGLVLCRGSAVETSGKSDNIKPRILTKGQKVQAQTSTVCVIPLDLIKNLGRKHFDAAASAQSNSGKHKWFARHDFYFYLLDFPRRLSTDRSEIWPRFVNWSRRQ